MPSTQTLALFAIASAGLVAIPGPAVFYIVTRGVVHGRRGALVSVLGVESGTSSPCSRRPSGSRP